MVMSLRSKWAAGKARGGRIPLHFLYSWYCWTLLGSIKVGRDVTDEQGSRRPIFIATLWAAASWLFFPRCSLLAYRFRYARRSRLEKQPTDLRLRAPGGR